MSEGPRRPWRRHSVARVDAVNHTAFFEALARASRVPEAWPGSSTSASLRVGLSDQRCNWSLARYAGLRLAEKGALAQLGDRDVDGSDAGVQIAVAVAVALRDPARCGAAVLGADHGVGVRGQQGVDHRLQQRAHQIRTRLGERFAEQACRGRQCEERSS